MVHFGSQSINQIGLRALREQCQGLIDFNEAYDYFGKSRLTKTHRASRNSVPVLHQSRGYYLSSDKRIIKGPGAPKEEVAAQVKSCAKPEVECHTTRLAAFLPSDSLHQLSLRAKAGVHEIGGEFFCHKGRRTQRLILRKT